MSPHRLQRTGKAFQDKVDRLALALWKQKEGLSVSDAVIIANLYNKLGEHDKKPLRFNL